MLPTKKKCVITFIAYVVIVVCMNGWLVELSWVRERTIIDIHECVCVCAPLFGVLFCYCVWVTDRSTASFNISVIVIVSDANRARSLRLKLVATSTVDEEQQVGTNTKATKNTHTHTYTTIRIKISMQERSIFLISNTIFENDQWIINYGWLMTGKWFQNSKQDMYGGKCILRRLKKILKRGFKANLWYFCVFFSFFFSLFLNEITKICIWITGGLLKYLINENQVKTKKKNKKLTTTALAIATTKC